MEEKEKKDALEGDWTGQESRDQEPAASSGEAMDRLARELEDKTREAAENRDLYLRARADLDNFKKRMQREKAEAIRFANEALIRDLLPVLDNLERAVAHAASGGNGQPLVEGVRMVLDGALDVLQNHGVSRVEAEGQPFDPSQHEAVLQVPNSEVAPNHVVEQFLPGYCLHERLLRAAQVSVSAKPTVEKGEDDD